MHFAVESGQINEYLDKLEILRWQIRIKTPLVYAQAIKLLDGPILQSGMIISLLMKIIL